MSNTITIEQIKSLRNKTGLSISLCKDALEKSNGDEQKAIDIIEKECNTSIRNSSKVPTKGIVRCYEHNGSTLGVILEVSCETDSVSRNDEFKQFATNVAMQIASMNPEYISLSNIPEEELNRKKTIFIAQLEDEAKITGKTKPPQAIDKIVEGKINKWCTDVCLMNQEFFMGTNKQTIEQLLNLLSVKFGEKIIIKRFERYEIL